MTISAGRAAARPGCERLLVAIGERRVGIVLAVAVSRRARNGRDWHTWLELCGLIDCIMADADGLYDARSPNDRLLLGMKGTMSEMELSILRQRSMEALKRKARGGELFLTVAIGYIKVRHHLLQRDSEGSRSAHPRGGACCFRQGRGWSEASPGAELWLRQQEITLPAVEYGPEGRTVEYGPEGRTVVWKPPVSTTIHHILTNPIYAGGYDAGA